MNPPGATSYIFATVAVLAQVLLIMVVLVLDRHTDVAVTARAVFFFVCSALNAVYLFLLARSCQPLQSLIAQVPANIGHRRVKLALTCLFGVFAFSVACVALIMVFRPFPLSADNPYWAYMFGHANRIRAGQDNALLILLSYLAPRVIFSCIVVPIVEECLFIGVVFDTLHTRTSSIWIAQGISAVLFPALHCLAYSSKTGDIAFWVLIGSLRYFLNALYLHTSNLAVPIVAHILWNLFYVLYHVVPYL